MNSGGINYDFNCPPNSDKARECPILSVDTRVLNTTSALMTEYPSYYTPGMNGYPCTFTTWKNNGTILGIDAKLASLPTVPYCALTYELWFWDLSDPA